MVGDKDATFTIQKIWKTKSGQKLVNIPKSCVNVEAGDYVLIVKITKESVLDKRFSDELKVRIRDLFDVTQDLKLMHEEFLEYQA